MVLYLNAFLEHPACHQEFFDSGGLPLFLDVLAKHKDGNTFKSLCNIARNSDHLLRVMASEPALSAQLALVFTKGPENCKEHCIHLVSLFAAAGLPIHPSVVAIVIPSLIDFLSSSPKIPPLLILRALFFFCKTYDHARLVAANGGMEAVTNFLANAKGVERKHAIGLMTSIPEIEPPATITNFRSLSSPKNEQHIFQFLCVGQEPTEEMIVYMLNQMDKGDFTTTIFSSLSAFIANGSERAKQLDMFPHFQTAAKHIIEGKKLSPTVIESFLLLGCLILDSENVVRMEEICGSLETVIEGRNDQIAWLMYFFQLARMVFTVLVELLY